MKSPVDGDVNARQIQSQVRPPKPKAILELVGPDPIKHNSKPRAMLDALDTSEEEHHTQLEQLTRPGPRKSAESMSPIPRPKVRR